MLAHNVYVVCARPTLIGQDLVVMIGTRDSCQNQIGVGVNFIVNFPFWTDNKTKQNKTHSVLNVIAEPTRYLVVVLNFVVVVVVVVVVVMFRCDRRFDPY